jgi:hypothetical protein
MEMVRQAILRMTLKDTSNVLTKRLQIQKKIAYLRIRNGGCGIIY